MNYFLVDTRKVVQVLHARVLFLAVFFLYVHHKAFLCICLMETKPRDGWFADSIQI